MAVCTKESDLTSSVEFEQPEFSEANERIKRAEKEKIEKLDLSKLKLLEIPLEVLDLTKIKRLHLCRNRLLEIPDELCLKMCHLHWLDLRSNLLTRLPSTIRYMKCLKILLLDDNRIKILPFELGFLRRLKGIHVRNNPLEFPPKNIMERGPRGILKFLHDCYVSREESSTPRGSRLYKRIMMEQNAAFSGKNNSADPNILMPKCAEECFTAEQLAEFSKIEMVCKRLQENLALNKTEDGVESETMNSSSKPMTPSTDTFESPSSESEHTIKTRELEINESSLNKSNDLPKDSEDDTELEKMLKYSQLAETLTSDGMQERTRTNSAPSSTREFALPWVATSSELYKKVKKQYLDEKRNPRKPFRTTAFGTFSTQSARHNALLPENPPQPTVEKIRAQHAKEKYKQARQQAMIKQQAILQKLKDSERVRGWRQAYTAQQKAKLMEYLSKTQMDIRKEADQRISAAPFDIGQNDLKMLGTAELNSLRWQSIRSASPPPNLSAEMAFQLELDSLERDRRLTQQVQHHLSEIGDRFQSPLPLARKNLQNEMLTAKRDLELALRLHQRVKRRMETLQHFRGSNRRDLW